MHHTKLRRVLSAALAGAALLLSGCAVEGSSAAESAAEGRTVRVTLGIERYPTRRYDGFALPAGEYESLRVVLGEGEGHNWWCVAFPPLCTGAMTDDELRAAMETEDYGIISEQDGYLLKFKIIELWESLKALLPLQ